MWPETCMFTMGSSPKMHSVDVPPSTGSLNYVYIIIVY